VSRLDEFHWFAFFLVNDVQIAFNSPTEPYPLHSPHFKELSTKSYIDFLSYVLKMRSMHIMNVSVLIT
jgi:hypothetical protein